MAATFLFPCPHCNQPTELSTVQAGQELNCAQCDGPITAPKLGELKKLPPTDAAATSGADNTLSARNSDHPNRAGDSQLKRTLFASGLAIALIAGILGTALYYYATNYLIADVDWDGHFATINQQIDEMSPAQLLASWNQMEPEKGLGEWKEQPLLRYRVQGEYLQTIAYGLWGLAIAGLLTMATARRMKSSS
jgi:hypothetical protein